MEMNWEKWSKGLYELLIGHLDEDDVSIEGGKRIYHEIEICNVGLYRSEAEMRDLLWNRIVNEETFKIIARRDFNDIHPICVKPKYENVIRILKNSIAKSLISKKNTLELSTLALEDYSVGYIRHPNMRVFNCLVRSSRHNTIRDILKSNLSWLLRVRNLGIKSAEQIVEMMDGLGFHEWAEGMRQEMSKTPKEIAISEAERYIWSLEGL